MARRSVPGRAEADNDSLFPFLSPVRGFGLSRRVHKNDLGGFDPLDFNAVFARDCDAVSLAGKGFGCPAGIYSTATGQQPDLNNPQRHIAVVVFGMPDSTAGAQCLYVSGTNLTAATRIVFVLEYAFPDVGDDLHVPVRVHRKAAVWSDLVVIPDHEAAERRVRRVA